MKKFNRKLLILFVLVFSVFMTQINVYVDGDEGFDPGKADLLKDFNFVIRQDGIKIGDDDEINTTKNLSLEVDFGFPIKGDFDGTPPSDKIIKKGDFAEIVVSEHLDKITDAKIPLEFGNEKIGYVTFINRDDGRGLIARIEFYDESDETVGNILDDERYSEVVAGFNAELKQTGEYDKDDEGNKILEIFEKTYKVTTPNLEQTFITSKNGEADLKEGTITWTVKIKGTEAYEGGQPTDLDLEGFVFEDDLSDVGEYVGDSFHLDGDPNPEVISVDKKISYTFKEGSTGEQIITFKTKINPEYLNTNEQVTINNNAVLKVDEENIPIDGTATFTPIWINKTGAAHDFTVEDGKPVQRITWTIEVNQNEADLENVVITDEIPAGLLWESATLFTFNGSEWQEVENPKFDNHPTDDKYLIDELETMAKLVIVTKVDIDDNDFVSGEIDKYNNSATINWGSNGDDGGYGDSSGDIGVGYNPISKSGVANNEDQTITWTVNVDTKGQTNFPEELVVYDLLVHGESLPDEFSFDGLDLDISDLTPNYNQRFAEFTESDVVDYEVKEIMHEDKKIADLLKVTLKGGNSTHEYSFKTYITNPDITLGNKTTNMKNVATLFGNDKKLNDAYANVDYTNSILEKEMLHRDAHDALSDAEEIVDSANQRANNLKEGYNYLDDSVIYRLTVNQDQIDVSNVEVDAEGTKAGEVTVVDTLPKGWVFDDIDGKEFLIFEADKHGDATEEVEVNNLTSKFATNDAGRKTATFIFEDLADRYVILLKAKPNEDTLVNYFDNNGTFTETNTVKLNTEEWKTGVEEEQKVTIDSTVLAKDMDGPNEDSDVITWSVIFNPYNLEDAFKANPKLFLTDILSEGMELLLDASGNFELEGIRLYELELKSDGTLTDSKKIELDADQKVFEYDAEKRELTLNIEYNNKAYRFEYDTDITGSKNEVINNKVVLEGTEKDVDSVEKSYTIQDADGWATMQRRGLVRINKTDRSTPLKGVEFTLFDVTGEIPLRVVTTNDDGQIILRGLVEGEYTLKETKALEGYVNHDVVYKIKVVIGEKATTTINGQELEKNQINIVNYKKGTRGNLALTKKIAGNAAYEYDDFVFTFNFTNVDGVTIEDEFMYVNDNGEILGTISSGGTITLKADERVTILGIEQGTKYTVTEDDYTEVGYVTESENHEGDIVVDETIEVTYTNTRNNNLTIYKSNEFEMLLEGAVFRLEMLVDGEYETVLEALTTEDGIIALEGIDVGSYRLVETKAPEGYVLNTNHVEFDVVEEEGITLNAQAVVFNYQGSVKLTKLDEDGNLLDGVIFELYRGEELVAEGLETDEAGVIFVDGLAPGDYHFAEVSNPHGQIVNPTMREFTIVDKFDDKPEVELLNVVNAFGRVEFAKVDKDGNAVADAVFSLCMVDEAGELIEVAGGVKSDELGIVAIDGLTPGDYVIKEIMAADGYILNTTDIKFTVDEKAETDKLVVELDDFVNYQGELDVNKVDKEDRLIDGAVFEVLDVDGKVIAEFTVEKGTHKLDGLAPGKYTLKEKTAPKGFKLSREVFDFEVVAEHEGELDTIVIKVVNEKITRVPGTGISGDAYYYLAILLIGLMILVINTYPYIKRKYNK